MGESILKMAINYGLMSALFVALLVWVLRDTRSREQRYQEMLDKLHDALSVVHEIQKTTKQISNTLVILTKDVSLLNKRERKENVESAAKTVG
jgi:hypothetical protein